MNEIKMLSQRRRDRIIQRSDGVLTRGRVRIVREIGGDESVGLCDCDVDSDPVASRGQRL